MVIMQKPASAINGRFKDNKKPARGGLGGGEADALELESVGYLRALFRVRQLV